MKIIKERSVHKEREYYLEYRWKDDPDAGFSFPANPDETPVLENMSDDMKKNYEFCLNSPDKLDYFFNDYEITYVEPAVGLCHCGTAVALDADFAYHSAVQCEKCGQWYNLFGQKLVDPEYWEEDDDDDDYYNNWE